MGTEAFYVDGTNPEDYTNNNLANPSGTGTGTFNIEGVIEENFVLGATVDSKITYKTAAEVSWKDGPSVA